MLFIFYFLYYRHILSILNKASWAAHGDFFVEISSCKKWRFFSHSYLTSRTNLHFSNSDPHLFLEKRYKYLLGTKEQESYRCKVAVGNSSGGRCLACTKCESGPGEEENKTQGLEDLPVFQVFVVILFFFWKNVQYLKRVAWFTLERDDVVH